MLNSFTRWGFYLIPHLCRSKISCYQAGRESAPSLLPIFSHTQSILSYPVTVGYLWYDHSTLAIPPILEDNSFCSQHVGFFCCCGCPLPGLENGRCISSLWIQHIPTPALSVNKAGSVEGKNSSNITVVRCRWSWGTLQGFGTESTLVAHWAGCGIAGINEKALFWAVNRRVIVQSLAVPDARIFFKTIVLELVLLIWQYKEAELSGILHRVLAQPVHALITGA